MAKIYMVRHGRAQAGYGAAIDPGLDELGVEQAQKAARSLAPLGPLPIVSSPLARARETAVPLARHWGADPRLDDRFGEIASPTQDLSGRAEWLEAVIPNRWPNLDSGLRAWRQGVIDALFEIERDTVVFSHFIAINVAVGLASGDDRVVCLFPDNGSIIVFELGPSGLCIIEGGSQASTEIR